jgi:integrase/recombinase XerC
MPCQQYPSIRSFFEYLKYEKRYSAHTLTSYQTDITGFFDYLETQFGGIPIKQIDHNFIRSWLAGLKDNGLSSRSINRKISCLRSFFKYCLKTGMVDASPMIKVTGPKSGKRLPVFVKEDDSRKLMETLGHSTEDWKSLNAQLLITVFYSTGMRLSELINLKERQVDAGRCQVKVLGKGNKERIIPVSKELVTLIRDYIDQKKKRLPGQERAEKTDPVLLVTEKGKKLYPKYAWLLVNEVLGKSSSLDKRSPHVLRHSFATHLMNNGANLNAVKELLGHSSLAATQVYTHNTIEKLKVIHKRSHPKA